MEKLTGNHNSPLGWDGVGGMEWVEWNGVKWSGIRKGVETRSVWEFVYFSVHQLWNCYKLKSLLLRGLHFGLLCLINHSLIESRLSIQYKKHILTELNNTNYIVRDVERTWSSVHCPAVYKMLPWTNERNAEKLNCSTWTSTKDFISVGYARDLY